jgi:galactokinase
MKTNLLPGATWFAAAPGRVNLLGEHIDYNDGIVLPVAIDRTVQVEARPLPGDVVRLQAVDLGAAAAFSLAALDQKVDLEGKPLPSWALYPAGVAWALRQNGFRVSGLEAAYTSNVPIGAGLSSSAAVEVAFAVLWQALGGWPASRMRLAQMCQQTENSYIGLHSGLMDQFASANGVEGQALAFDTRSLAWEAVPLPAHTLIVIADSKVRRSLATSAYNDRRAACEQALALLQPHLPGIRALRDVSPAEFERLADRLPELVARRARHVVQECARVAEALACLKAGDGVGFGLLMNAGHVSLRDLYEVSCPELDRLVEIASSLPGCLGARLTGAGFGGCTVNLVKENQAAAFVADLRETYIRSTGRQAEVYLCRASQGATVNHVEQR